MSKILLIGNSGLKYHGSDGQTIKVRLYLKKIKDEGFDACFVDLERIFRKPISILMRIKKEVKKCDRIVLISASRGCKYLIPYINRINRKYNKPFVLPLVGTSVLHFSIDKLSDKKKNDFLFNSNYSFCEPNQKLIKQLSKITYILPETELLKKTFEEFYGLNNVYQLNNFRDFSSKQPNNSCGDSLKMVYVSRVMKNKGIFDLMSTVNKLSLNNYKVSLDIFGKIIMSKNEKVIFDEFVKSNAIHYCGELSNDDVVNTISNYDIFVFPTRFVGEGTPGVIAESLIAGVPVLTSDYPQANTILNNGFDSIFFKMFDNKDLEEKIVYIISNKELLKSIKAGAYESGKKYTYLYERDNFLKLVCGVDKK